MAGQRRRRGGRKGADGDEAGREGLVFGQHAAREAMSYDPAGVEAVWLERGRRDQRLERQLAKLEKGGVPIRRVPCSELDELAEGGNHQGIVVRYTGTPARGESELADLLDAQPEPLLLVLDQVQDPHNLGACLRTAAAAGGHGVVAPRDRSAALTPAVHKTAAGGVQRIPFFQVTNLARTLQQMAEAGVFIIGTAGDDQAQDLYALDLQGPLALVLGGEAEGMRRLTRERCDAVAAIPMPGRMESLNVSVAAGVVLFEAVRQRFPRGEGVGYNR